MIKQRNYSNMSSFISQHEHTLHIRRLNKIKGSIDTRGPLKPIHLIYNRKRESLMQEKTDKILMENQILLRKMMNIDTRNPTKKGLKGQKQIQGNSLNYSLIKKNMININTENHAILRRLQNIRPKLSISKMENDYVKYQYLSSQISKNRESYEKNTYFLREGQESRQSVTQMNGFFPSSASIRRSRPGTANPRLREQSMNKHSSFSLNKSRGAERSHTNTEGELGGKPDLDRDLLPPDMSEQA